MRNITLLNPEIAQQIFEHYKWLDESKYFIKVESATSDTLCSATYSCKYIGGEKLIIGFGSQYTIPLEEFSNEIKLELKDIHNLGTLLTINHVPYFLRVYRTSTEKEINKVGELFPELQIVDFGSVTNEHIKNLHGIAPCSNLHTLNLNNCPGLQDISGLSLFKKLKTLCLDGFTDSSQFNFIASCKTLVHLSQNKSQLSGIEHVAGLSILNRISISHNLTLTDLSPLSGLNALTRLNLGDCNYITDLSPLSSLSALTYLNLESCKNFTDLSPLSGLSALTYLNLSFCENLTDLLPLSSLSALTYLDLDCCENLTDLLPLSGLSALTYLNLTYCKNFTDFSPLSGLSALTYLDLGSCENLTDLSPLSGLSALTRLNLGYCNYITDLSPLSSLSALTYLNLRSSPQRKSMSSLTDLSPLSGLNALTYLNLGDCENLTDLSHLSGLSALTYLNLESCKNFTDFSPLSGLSALTYLNLSFCENLTDLSTLSGLSALTRLNLSSCKNLTRIQKICNLPRLKEIKLTNSPNIRDFEKLALLPNLEELTWIDPVACSMVLMTSAINSLNQAFISTEFSVWIDELTLSKEAKAYAIKLLSCLGILKQTAYQQFLPDLVSAMRRRGLQSEERNDLDAYTWEMWCNLALSLDNADAISYLQAAVNELDIERESEVILGPVIIAFAELIEKHPEENEALIEWVHLQLQQLENHGEQQRQIAPSAAVFFASLNKKDDVLFWLQKATDEKAPMWRERVLHALIKFYAKKENFTEARRLLDEMQVQDEKDRAIAALAQAMAASHPVEAGFLLDEINELNIRSEAAHKMLPQPSMLSAPQGIYQLLLHLQSNPDELASALEMIIERDTVGSIAEAVKQLFIQTQTSGPSAAVLLELCKHPSIADFVKPRALEKYKSELQERANRELSQSVPYLITEMQNSTLLAEDEAQELTTLMQTT